MQKAIFIGADYAQIETRVIAWLAEEAGLLQAFRNGVDIYSEFGTSYLFGYPVSRDTPRERKLAKATVLGCVFGMGANTFRETCERNAIEIDQATAEHAVRALRAYVPNVVRLWWRLKDGIMALAGEVPPYYIGHLYMAPGVIVKPSGSKIYYHHLRCSNFNEWSFTAGRHNGDSRVKLWHGLLAENVTQSVARDVLGNAIVRILRLIDKGHLPAYMEPVLTTHDDLVFRVPEQAADEAEATIKELMSKPPKWAIDLPIEVEVKKGENYGQI